MKQNTYGTESGMLEAGSFKGLTRPMNSSRDSSRERAHTTKQPDWTRSKISAQPKCEWTKPSITPSSEPRRQAGARPLWWGNGFTESLTCSRSSDAGDRAETWTRVRRKQGLWLSCHAERDTDTSMETHFTNQGSMAAPGPRPCVAEHKEITGNSDPKVFTTH